MSSIGTTHNPTTIRARAGIDCAITANHQCELIEYRDDGTERTTRTPIDLARPEHWNPPPSRPDRTSLEHEQIGPQFGASFSWEDGNGIQHGWGGRHR